MWRDLQDAIRCPVTLEPYSSENGPNRPRILAHCGHTLSEAAITQILQTHPSRRLCPVCQAPICRQRARMGIAGFPPNFALADVIDSLLQQQPLCMRDTNAWMNGPCLLMLQQGAYTLDCLAAGGKAEEDGVGGAVERNRLQLPASPSVAEREWREVLRQHDLPGPLQLGLEVWGVSRGQHPVLKGALPEHEVEVAVLSLSHGNEPEAKFLSRQFVLQQLFTSNLPAFRFKALPVLGVVETAQRLLLVMHLPECCLGELVCVPARKRSDSVRLPNLLRLGMGVSFSLADLHASGYHHGGVSLLSIMVMRDGDIRLAPFTRADVPGPPGALEALSRSPGQPGVWVRSTSMAAAARAADVWGLCAALLVAGLHLPWRQLPGLTGVREQGAASVWDKVFQAVEQEARLESYAALFLDVVNDGLGTSLSMCDLHTRLHAQVQEQRARTRYWVKKAVTAAHVLSVMLGALAVTYGVAGHGQGVEFQANQGRDHFGLWW